MSTNIFRTKLLLAHLRYLAFLAALVSISAQGQTWFESCDRVAARSRSFREYWENNEMPKGLCFLLNNKELIYSDKYGLMYQSLKTKKAETIPITDRNPEWVDFSNKSDFLTISGPRLVRTGNLVSAIEFDLYRSNQ